MAAGGHDRERSPRWRPTGHRPSPDDLTSLAPAATPAGNATRVSLPSCRDNSNYRGRWSSPRVGPRRVSISSELSMRRSRVGSLERAGHPRSRQRATTQNAIGRTCRPLRVGHRSAADRSRVVGPPQRRSAGRRARRGGRRLMDGPEAPAWARLGTNRVRPSAAASRVQPAIAKSPRAQLISALESRTLPARKGAGSSAGGRALGTGPPPGSADG